MLVRQSKFRGRGSRLRLFMTQISDRCKNIVVADMSFLSNFYQQLSGSNIYFGTGLNGRQRLTDTTKNCLVDEK